MLDEDCVEEDLGSTNIGLDGGQLRVINLLAPEFYI